MPLSVVSTSGNSGIKDPNFVLLFEEWSLFMQRRIPFRILTYSYATLRVSATGIFHKYQ